MHAPRLMAVLAHPDDESLGVGGTLAKYASEGVDVFLLTATRGDAGRYRGHRPSDDQHPGPIALASIREHELRAAASVLGVRDVALLEHGDQRLDSANPREVVENIAGHLRRVRPDVVVTFGPDGAYGHPDHIHRRRGRSLVHMPRGRRRAIAFGVETVLRGVARIDVGRVSGSVSSIVLSS